jgi:hypothetical protein
MIEQQLNNLWKLSFDEATSRGTKPLLKAVF